MTIPPLINFHTIPVTFEPINIFIYLKFYYDRATVECAAKFKTQQQYTLELNSPYTAYT